ncbi:CDP-glycerol glycerophosphotransferase family protein [Staphylococcus muscae]|uniref:Teichoic acid biosynthesis protein B n=1 Tax=Staphylococcus muscae TaxID=1294 RepID=A0A240BV28_9STAP|nr:teichoic acid glycerol-phosphate primase TarB [Staphylococcus muscae]AVQ34227.1 CDP-glycerol glycerophosphotransferase family protein [Staphylococcus muscae]PNZ05778.1 CDP-glycerol glycerophosphotransferase family protein [Staphylococcus muscae]GGA85026.1 teichoic acid biosynthesis protein B [Staphylococcus muscae]SNV99574.1 teichoic acid biosynthesis protein B [Staphylococcus muscae]
MSQIIIKKLYLILVNVIQCLCSRQRVQDNHVVVMMTFKEDLLPVIEKLSKKGYRVTVFTKASHFEALTHLQNVQIASINRRNLYQQIRSLRSAKVIFIDTYYHLFGALKKQSKQTVIQTWHAAGALKKFGLEDHAVNRDNKREVAQHQAVYDATDKYIVGCPQMTVCFKQSFGAENHQFLNYGIPRLTNYLDVDILEEQHQLKKKLEIQGKVAVYLPTYREEGQLNRVIDQKAFNKALPNYTLLSQYHPAVESPQTEQAITLSTRELLMIADIVITDYSSLAIEASLFGKPAIFYVYDEMAYEQVRGLNRYYYDIPERYKVYHEAELYQRIREENLKPLFEDWHIFNTKESLEKLMTYVDDVIQA